jgi:hypothetical protein
MNHSLEQFPGHRSGNHSSDSGNRPFTSGKRPFPLGNFHFTDGNRPMTSRSPISIFGNGRFNSGKPIINSHNHLIIAKKASDGRAISRTHSFPESVALPELASDGSLFTSMFWFSYRGLTPHLHRAHAGHTQAGTCDGEQAARTDMQACQPAAHGLCVRQLMQTYPQIRDLIAPLMNESMIIGLRAEGLSVDLVDGKVTAKVVQLVTLMESTVTLVADVQEVFTVHHPSFDTGEDGVEPAYDEQLTYNLLRVASEYEGHLSGSVGLAYGPIKGIDLLRQPVEIRSDQGGSTSQRFAGIQFTLDERMMGGRRFCYRIVQKPASDILEISQLEDSSDLGSLAVVE